MSKARKRVWVGVVAAAVGAGLAAGVVLAYRAVVHPTFRIVNAASQRVTDIRCEFSAEGRMWTEEIDRLAPGEAREFSAPTSDLVLNRFVYSLRGRHAWEEGILATPLETVVVRIEGPGEATSFYKH